MSRKVLQRSGVCEKHWNVRFAFRLVCRRESQRDRNELTVQREIEQLLAVVTPSHLDAPIIRNTDFCSGAGERLEVNLEPSRFVGLIRHPFPIGRELSIALFKVRSDNRKGLAVSG